MSGEDKDFDFAALLKRAAIENHSESRKDPKFKRRGLMTADERRAQEEWADSISGLSTRTKNELLNKGVSSDDHLRWIIENGKLRKYRGIGATMENEIRKYLGMKPLPKKGKGPWKFDPWTGKPIKREKS